jgi:hypothetical protein
MKNDGLDGEITGRAKGGRFAPGNPGGPGRPRRETERDYLRVMTEAVPLETWKAIVESAVRDAGQGDRAAREWLASYLMGRPEGTASTLHELAVEEAAGSDPVERGAAIAREVDLLDSVMRNY